MIILPHIKSSTPFSFIVSKSQFIVSELALLFASVSIVVGRSECMVLLEESECVSCEHVDIIFYVQLNYRVHTRTYVRTCTYPISNFSRTRVPRSRWLLDRDFSDLVSGCSIEMHL